MSFEGIKTSSLITFTISIHYAHCLSFAPSTRPEESSGGSQSRKAEHIFQIEDASLVTSMNRSTMGAKHHLAALSESESDGVEEVIMPRKSKKQETPILENGGEDEQEEDDDEEEGDEDEVT